MTSALDMGCLPQVCPKITCQISRPSMKQGGLASAKAMRRSGNLCTSRKAVRLSEEAKGELERRVLGLVIVLRVEVFDFRGSHVQLRLGQFDNRSQAQIVSPLRELERKRGLPQKLRGN